MSPRLPDTVDHWPIDRLHAYARNPRTHSEDQVAQIAASIVEFGWTNPVLVSADGTVIAGHGRLEAARRLGLDAVPVLVLDHLSEAQRRAYVITDNKLALNSGWNDELLAAELHALNGDGFDLSLIGFDEGELDRLMAPLEDEEVPASEASDEDADETPDPPRDPVSRAGDLWRLGRHRLLCGDSTDGAAVARLMDGGRASLLFTSPPYGNQRDYTTGGIGDWDKLMQGVFGQLGVVMANEGQVLVNLGLVHRDNEWQPYWGAWLDWMRSVGWRRFGLYVWDQGAGMPGDWAGRLAPAFEFVFHFNRQARKPNKIVPCKTAGEVGHAPGSAGMRRKDSSFNAWTHGGQPTQEFRIPDSVIRIERHHGAVGRDLSHPAPFPVKLVEHVMLAFTNADGIVYEPFGGSGTTIIAGERTGRQVHAIELAPEYVDVALLRWRQLYPSSAVTLEGDGRRFEEIAAERGVEIKDAA
jgi:DNA modification methylase